MSRTNSTTESVTPATADATTHPVPDASAGGSSTPPLTSTGRRPGSARSRSLPAVEPDASRSVRGTEERRTALAAFLHALARRVEQDPAFARTLLSVYAESSASPAHGGSRPLAAPSRAGTADAAGASARRAQVVAVPPFDPFVVLREQGEMALRERLSALDLAALRATLRAHRLDPARIAARWTARDRIVDLIVEQVRARTSLGRAFERV